MAPSGMTNASLAGVCAAFAGICAKFALSPENPQVLVRILDAYIPPSYNAWIIRGFFAVATLTFNSLMLTLTAKALQLCPTTVQSVVTTSAVNFLVTGILGTVFLGEHIGFIGVIGMIFIQIGVLIISNEKEKVD
ncbi:uncharacterized protein LOC130703432 [Daphnia carinata]|uniref:uncharacterized protein LOC130703432 n=1 Tax=Daphnia carinata TaxID=120202 RepID=UPI00257E51C8|nr:uncharacterized protein LOC130703432 [Daphnia carinata]